MKVQIRNKLSLFWSPEQIAGYFRIQGLDCVSHERIYQMVWQDKKGGGCSTSSFAEGAEDIGREVASTCTAGRYRTGWTYRRDRP